MFLNVMAIFLLIKDLGHVGIALALSIASWMNAIILYIFIYLKGYWKLKFLFLKKTIKLLIVFIVSINVVDALEYFIIYFDLVDTSTLFKKVLLLSYLIIIAITTFILFCIIFRILSIKDLNRNKLNNLFRGN